MRTVFLAVVFFMAASAEADQSRNPHMDAARVCGYRTCEGRERSGHIRNAAVCRVGVSTVYRSVVDQGNDFSIAVERGENRCRGAYSAQNDQLDCLTGVRALEDCYEMVRFRH